MESGVGDSSEAWRMEKQHPTAIKGRKKLNPPRPLAVWSGWQVAAAAPSASLLPPEVNAGS